MKNIEITLTTKYELYIKILKYATEIVNEPKIFNLLLLTIHRELKF